MATRELLLTILVTVLVAISIAVAFQTINSGEMAPNRTAIVQGLNTAIGRSRAYFDRPVMYGGGQYSFEGITFQDLLMDSVNAHGTYELTEVQHKSIKLIGRPIDSDDNIIVTVYRDSVVWE